MKKYEVSYLGKKYEVQVDTKLIVSEIEKGLKSKGVEKFSKPRVNVYEKFSFGPTGLWVGVDDYKIFGYGPRIDIRLKNLPTYFKIIVLKNIIWRRMTMEEMLIERLNFLVGHEIGYAYTMKDTWFETALYYGFMIIGGLITAVLVWFLTSSSVLTVIAFFIGKYVFYEFSPWERMADKYSKEKFKKRPIVVSLIE